MKITIIIGFLFFAGHCVGQSDSTAKAAKIPETSRVNSIAHSDTLHARATPATGNDSIRKKEIMLLSDQDSSSPGKSPSSTGVKPPLRWDEDTAFARLLTFGHYNTNGGGLLNDGVIREPEGKEQLFYILAGLVLFMGIVKASYPRYFQDIFRLFIQASQRQKQTPEQIVQGIIPGFLFNILFFVVGGMLIALYGIKINYVTGPLWLLVLYCAGILAVIYLIKYCVTTLAGWVFNVKDAAGMYSFIVFLINRVVGIVLLPVLILIAFYSGDTNTVLFTAAASLVFFLVIYRYALSLTIIRKNLKVSALHFFIYLCAVELMPLLVIYKELFNQVHSK